MVGSYKNYINGKWINSKSGKIFKSYNPANGSVLGTFQFSNSEDVDAAVDAANKAFKSWSETPPPKRAEILLKVAEILKKRKAELGKLVTQEMGKQLKEGLGDVQEAIDIFEYMHGEGRRLLGYTTTSELSKKFSMTIRRPIGAVGLITPWNFPIAIPAWKLSAALICGNTVVFKPATDTPLCAVKLIQVLEQAGIPKGVVNLVTGNGSEVGENIVKHPKLKAISFTGSVEVGRSIAENAGLKKVGLELGGKNPIIVMHDADLDLAVDGVLWGGFGTTGQRCTAASRVIVHRAVLHKFLNKLLFKTKQLTIGDGLKCDVGPLINAHQLHKVHRYVMIGIQEGAKLLCGGKIIEGKGNFYEPTIFTNVTKDMVIAREEIFGPVICVMPVSNFDEAIEVANSVDYGLSSAIYTNNVDLAFEAIEKLEAGLTYVNSSTIGSEVHLPFGGVKNTGNGSREAGIEGIHEFSETKTIYVDYSGKLQKAQIEDD